MTEGKNKDTPIQYVPSNLADNLDAEGRSIGDPSMGEGRPSMGAFSGLMDLRQSESRSGIQADSSYCMTNLDKSNGNSFRSPAQPGGIAGVVGGISGGGISAGEIFGGGISDKNVPVSAGNLSDFKSDLWVSPIFGADIEDKNKNTNNPGLNPKATPLVYSETPRSDLWGPTPSLNPKQPSSTQPFNSIDNPLLIRPVTGGSSSSAQQQFPSREVADPQQYQPVSSASWKTVPAAANAPFYPGQWVPNEVRPVLGAIENPPVVVQNETHIVEYGPAYSMPYKRRCEADKVPVVYTGFLPLEGVNKEDDNCRVG